MGINKKTLTDNLPDLPGVYLMKDIKGEVIYIGKASSLRKRTKSYFYKNSSLSPYKNLLVSNISKIDYVVTNSVEEALIFESALIKQYAPKYNVVLKDDKSYPFLKLTVKEDFPRLFITRKRINDGSKYFGPYTDVKLLRKAISFIRKVFPLRTCRVMPKNICLNYHIGQCLGPCEKHIDKSAYQGVVNEVTLFLKGKKQRLMNDLLEKMAIASRKKNFEYAAKLRDRIQALNVLSPQYGKELPVNLPANPKVIEGFDISNLSGREAVGSMVRFIDGKPDKKNYRKYKIKTVNGINDYMMMRELVGRRYKNMENVGLLPDLIVIDGGRGHLNSAKQELERLGLGNIAVVGIAKKYDYLYFVNKDRPVMLPRRLSLLKLIQRVRDEAHRFALLYHRKLRAKAMIR